MDDLKKRWSITYTKHIKQKRKVYQDGFLDLHTSTNKVKLFDHCEKLLECRILKDEEIVSPGETLTFNGYLVDVGDPEGGDHNPISNLNQQERDEKVIERPNLMPRKKFRSPSISCDEAENKKTWRNNLSPSQKIIREFKKSEMQRYGVPHSDPDTQKPSTTEWQVLYTTQLTQKAKKYHDGFLRLTISGSLGRQVTLYDASRKLLSTKFLKADEKIRSGESISLDAHLVEIGEPGGKHKPLGDSNIQQNHGNIVGETQTAHRQQNCFKTNISVGKDFKKTEVHKREAPESSADATKSNMTAWQVSYTTQMTQKAKKYHDGFLKLANCGFLVRQIMLYDASRTLLDSRFLKKDETIRPGESIAFDAHLVDIGEPEVENELLMNGITQGNNPNVVGKSGIIVTHKNCLEDNKSVTKEWHVLYTNQITQKAKKYHTGILRLASCGSYRMQVTLLNEDKTILSSKFLSLSEHVRKGSTLALPKYLVEVDEPCMNPEGKPQEHTCSRSHANSNFSISSIHEINLSERDHMNNLLDGNFHSNASLREDADSSSIPSVDRRLINAVPRNKPLRDACQILSILQRPVAQDSVVAGCTDNNMTLPVSYTKEIQVLDACVQCHEDCQLPRAMLPDHGPSEIVDIVGSSTIVDTGKSADLTSSSAFIFVASELSRDNDAGNSDQCHLDGMEADTKQHDQASVSGISSSAVFSASYGPCDDKRKSFELLKSAREVDEWPTFDLGF